MVFHLHLSLSFPYFIYSLHSHSIRIHTSIAWPSVARQSNCTYTEQNSSEREANRQKDKNNKRSNACILFYFMCGTDIGSRWEFSSLSLSLFVCVFFCSFCSVIKSVFQKSHAHLLVFWVELMSLWGKKLKIFFYNYINLKLSLCVVKFGN